MDYPSEHELARNAPPGTAGDWLLLGSGVALVAAGLVQRSMSGLVAALGGASLAVYANQRARVTTRLDSPTAKSKGIVHLRESITLQGTPADIYRMLTDRQRLRAALPYFQHLELSPHGTWRWQVKAAAFPLTCEVELVENRPNERVAWRSIPTSSFASYGDLTLRPTNRGTELRLRVSYVPPGGLAGQTLAWLLTRPVENYLRENLRIFRQFFETGEVPMIHGQTSGRESTAREIERQRQAPAAALTPGLSAEAEAGLRV